MRTWTSSPETAATKGGEGAARAGMAQKTTKRSQAGRRTIRNIRKAPVLRHHRPHNRISDTFAPEFSMHRLLRHLLALTLLVLAGCASEEDVLPEEEEAR